MSSTYRLNTDELNESFLRSVKTLFPHRHVEISVLPLDAYSYNYNYNYNIDKHDDNDVHFSDSMPVPRFGSAKGAIHLSEDFDAPLDDFHEYMP
jgi:hypothetical protein